MAWIIDLDGVVWLGEEPIPGSRESIGRLCAAGERVLFLTNNSNLRIGAILARLHAHGVPADVDDVVTSARVAASLVEPGSTALACAGDGVVEALLARDVNVVEHGPADAVVVGFHRSFDFARLTAAFRAVNAGARLIAANDDPTLPSASGLLPGAGAILAAVSAATGVAAEVAGKPHPPMVEFTRSWLAGEEADTTLVGDRPATDGVMAGRLNVRFALVLSGATSARDLPVTPTPDLVAADLAALLWQAGDWSRLAP